MPCFTAHGKIFEKSLGAIVGSYSFDTYRPTNPQTGITLYVAFDPEKNEPVEILNNWIAQISRSVKANTLNSYYYSNKKFLEYLKVSLDHVEMLDDFEKVPAIFTIIQNYPFYLSKLPGINSKLYAVVRKKTGHDTIDGESIAKEVSHINKFLNASYHFSQLTESVNGEDITALNKYELHAHMQKIQTASSFQVRAMNTSTLLGAVIRKTNRISNEGLMHMPAVLKKKNRQSLQSEKIFPFSKFNQLLLHASIREKLFYTIIGGAGLRTHEGTQIRLDDIDGQDLLIRDFRQRSLMDGMTDVELSNMYAAKGRCIERVFWIPGYKQLFQQLLKLYLPWRKEQMRLGGIVKDHGFLFVKSKGEVGKPFYTTYRSSLDNTFRQLSNKAGVKDYTKHSLRHMYGNYMHNDIPTSEGTGLSLEIVRKLMGHSNIKSTQKYAQPSDKKIEALLTESLESTKYEDFPLISSNQELTISNIILNEVLVQIK